MGDRETNSKADAMQGSTVYIIMVKTCMRSCHVLICLDMKKIQKLKKMGLCCDVMQRNVNTNRKWTCHELLRAPAKIGCRMTGKLQPDMAAMRMPYPDVRANEGTIMQHNNASQEIVYTER